VGASQSDMEDSDSLFKTAKKQIVQTMKKLPLSIGVDFGCTHLVVSEKKDKKDNIEVLELSRQTNNTTDFIVKFEETMKIQLNPNLNSDEEDNYISSLKSCLKFGIQEQIENFSTVRPFLHNRKTKKIDLLDENHSIFIEPLELYSFYIQETFDAYSNILSSGKSKKHFLFSYPNQYTNNQKDQLKRQFEKNLKLKHCNERVFMYKEAPCALMKIFYEDSKSHSSLKNVAMLDIGDSSINFSTCTIKDDSNEIHIHNSGTCSIGGGTYTDKIYE
jgi:hypothetical protein